MKFSTEFDIGEVVYCVNANRVTPLTIGKITVEYINSPGMQRAKAYFDNYKPKKSHKEEYMCVETGIGTGQVYTAGVNIFKTENQAYAALGRLLECMKLS